MGAIYKIENLVNQKVYIGKTIRSPETRWKEHIRESLYENDNIPIHNAIRKYGLENFSFSIIEDNIEDIDILNQKEKDYIVKFNALSHDAGYNVCLGGDGGRTASKLTEEIVDKIVTILSDKDSLTSIPDIAKQYNVSSSVISRINLGETWHKDNIIYPIRDYSVTGLTITRSTYKNIIDDILYSEMPLKDIQGKYNLSEG